MTPTHAAKLGLVTSKADVVPQKMNGSTLEIYRMIIADFSVQNRLKKVRLFEETFLLTDTSMEIVLNIPFFTLPDAHILFAKKELTWRCYTIVKALLTIRRVELINRKKFATAALDNNSETFVIHVAILEISLEITKIIIHPS